jgi:flagellar biosynthesis chaperone FliJ
MGPTRDDLERRLAELKAEREAAEKQLALLGQREAEYRGTLQRNGAIEVLEEILASDTGTGRV